MTEKKKSKKALEEQEKEERLAAEQPPANGEAVSSAAEPEEGFKEEAGADAAPGGELPELQEAAALWQQEKEELLDRLKRKQADMDNLRRIGKQEQAEAREYALHEFLSRLLPVLDNLERALEATRCSGDVPGAHIEGLVMIRGQLVQLLEQEGVSAIEAKGSPFDPNCHDAVMQEDSADSEPGTVLEELQKGYRHRGRILRPAMVKVCRE